MSDDFSQSLTPPVSPFAGDSLCDLAPVRPPCFCCSDVKDDPAGVLSTEGYVVRGSLKRYNYLLPADCNRKKLSGTILCLRNAVSKNSLGKSGHFSV